MAVETTSMSSRGQIVIPQEIREKMNLHEGEKFVVVGTDDTILLKKIQSPSFKDLLKETREFVKKSALKEEDVVDIVHRARRKK